jgi:hypothetical protein
MVSCEALEGPTDLLSSSHFTSTAPPRPAKAEVTASKLSMDGFILSTNDKQQNKAKHQVKDWANAKLFLVYISPALQDGKRRRSNAKLFA